ncbi:MAG: hypothetical protein ACLQIB_13440 [Isosphaeraceae bacterium]
MSHELHYTSVPRGLKPGSRGFCTVATTPSLSRTLSERLESLSGYQPVYPPGDPLATLNPVVQAHVKISVAGRPLHVLSRIGPAGLDYSSRPNKYAHHVVLELGEGPQAGPAWLLGQAGFMETNWIGEPRALASGRAPPQGDRPPTVAHAWQADTGDPGWAGVLAEAFLADPRRPAYLVFRPGMQLLPLFEEAIALLPPSRRWDVEFSTYFNQLPQGISCAWRGVLDGSDLAGQAARLPGVLLFDLCRTPGRAQGGALVHLARTGERVDLPDAATGLHPVVEPSLDTVPPLPSSPGQRASSGGIDLIPELAALMTPGRSRAFSADSARSPRRRRSTGILIAALVTMPLLAIAGAAYLLWTTSREREYEVSSIATIPEAAPVIAGRAPAPKIARPATSARATPGKVERGIQTKPPAEKSNQAALATGAANNFVKPPPAPARPSPAPLGRASPGAPPNEPLARFFPVTRNAISGPRSDDAKNHTYRLEKNIRDVDILRASDKELDVERSGDRELRILTKSISALHDPVEVAKLKYDTKELSFDWRRITQQEPEIVAEVLDAVVKIRCEDGDVQYVLLRNPGVREERGTLALFGYSGKGPKTRSLSANWAEKDGLKATKRQFLIRRWRVACKWQDESDLFVVGSKATAGPMANDEQPIIPDEVTLRIKIDPTDPCNIQVRIEPGPRFKERLARLERQISEWEEQDLNLSRLLGRDLAARALDLKRDRDDRLQDLQARERGDERNDNIRQTKKELAELDKLLTSARIYSLAGTVERGDTDCKVELSLIVCLKLESGTLLDVARFGDFATSDR